MNINRNKEKSKLDSESKADPKIKINNFSVANEKDSEGIRNPVSINHNEHQIADAVAERPLNERVVEEQNLVGIGGGENDGELGDFVETPIADGQFIYNFDLQIELTASQMQEMTPEEKELLEFLKLENEGYKLAVLEFDEPKALLDGFRKSYLSPEFMTSIGQKFEMPFIFTLATKNSNGLDGIKDLELEKRLCNLSLLLKIDDTHTIKNETTTHIVLPALRDGNFRVWDCFGWFKHDPVIKNQLNRMAELCGITSSYVQLSYTRMEKFEYSPKIFYINAQNKGREQVEANCRNKIDNYKSSTLTVFHDNNFIPKDTKHRLQAKQQGLQGAEKLKKEVLLELKRTQVVFSNLHSCLSTLYPCKLNMYMAFEHLLNQSFRLTDCFLKYKENLFFRGFCKGLIQVLRIFIELIELLMPYAVEITKKFNINIKNDKGVNTIRKLKDVCSSKHLYEDFEKYEQFARESKKKLSKSMPQERINPTNNAEKSPAVKSVKNLSLEEENRRKLTIEENRKLSEAKNAEVKAAAEKARSIREENKTTKGKTLQERKTAQAQQIVDQHKKIAEENEAKVLAKRSQGEIKIHDLPSAEFVEETIIRNLKGPKLEYFKRVFGFINNDNTMDHENVLNLASWIKDILASNKVGCANDLFNEVKARIHRRHDSDKGALLPKHYIKILRTCFIICGIFPRKTCSLGAWEPTTVKDVKAMIKYQRRVMDKFLFANKSEM